MSAARYFNPKLRPAILAGLYPDWLQRHPRKSYIIAAILAAPSWVDRKELTAVYQEAKRRSLETGVEHVVDHIIPLNHPYICGLHVPWNLAILTRKQNAAKGNKWSPDQLGLFDSMSA